MPITPDRHTGPSDEEGIVWEELSSDPINDREQRYVQDKGLVILEDGIVRGVGESRENAFQPPADDRDVDTPPVTPDTGERVIVGDSPTGVFVSHEGEIAQWTSAAWVFSVPKHGTMIYVRDENSVYKQTAASTPWVWEESSGTGMTANDHKDIRQLIHLAEGGGPWDDFATAPYREPKSGSGPWDHGYMWWKSSSKTDAERIIEKTINRNANKTPSTIVWVVYNDSGVALVTATDTYAYTGVALHDDSITRTFS